MGVQQAALIGRPGDSGVCWSLMPPGPRGAGCQTKDEKTSWRWEGRWSEHRFSQEKRCEIG